jgi:pyruvate dehydrogenase E2 component (dihydrolipoamide acetyltransferase)
VPTIKLPQAAKSMQSGTVRRWLKKPGDSVQQGDLIVELETDAGVLQLESPVSGRMGEILLAEGKSGPINAPLVTIESDTAASPTPAPIAATPKPASSAPSGKVIPILMPKAGQSMEEGTINKWHVKPGATISKGQLIFEIETDKANMDVEAQDAGRLARIVSPEGSVVPVQQPVAYLADNDADVDALVGGSGPAPAPVAKVEAPAAAPQRASVVSSPAVSDGGRVKASPAARKIAGERGIALNAVAHGSGPGGRILSTDVPLSAAPVSGGRKRMSQMRKAIAKALSHSKQNIPHFYVKLTVDAAPSLAFYKAMKEQFPCSINDVIIFACSRLVKEFPSFRTKIEGDEFVEAPAANIGIAVGMDEGLVVPVLQGADRMKLQQIAAETKRLATSARAGKIEGMGSGSFTVTNLGMFGTEEFTAIINPPEAAILAVGAAREAVVVKDGALKPGKTMTVTLSVDHRIIDGVLAAKFLARLKELLEAPEKIV